MTDDSAPRVDAERTESPVGVQGTDHITIEGTNVADTVEFYRDILGMPLVLRQPNLDRTELTHLYFDTGDGRLLTAFVSEERESVDETDPDQGDVHHVAFRIDWERVAEIAAGLEDAGYPVSEYDRGAFHALYTEDNNGLTIELVADKFAIPDDRRGEVLARAHANRVDDGAEFVTTRHMRAALDDLGIDAEEREIGAAPAGREYGG
ncbi:VOC family protein [Halosimplex salinum]|uniref:VOC family protein n=1 Tax=Halosimplex salinum TaxID=1710538 RepID=UPI000F471DC7|nr:VOC family protein [Halosimplex salinum]